MFGDQLVRLPLLWDRLGVPRGRTGSRSGSGRTKPKEIFEPVPLALYFPILGVTPKIALYFPILGVRRVGWTHPIRWVVGTPLLDTSFKIVTCKDKE